MKRYASLLILLFPVLWSCNRDCSRETAARMMGDKFRQHLVFGQNWPVINAPFVLPDNSFDFKRPRKKFYFLHYFSADCDKCINNLLLARQFIKEKRSRFPNVDFVFVASGYNDTFIREAVAKTNFEYPIYFEKEYLRFKTSNKIPIDNEELYNNMLINDKDELLLFGSLYDNPKAESMFDDITNCSAL